MPKAPRGEKRSADVIEAVRVMRIAISKEPDDQEDVLPSSSAAQLGRLGGVARARKLTAEQRLCGMDSPPTQRWRSR
jgi:hypothetical protein